MKFAEVPKLLFQELRFERPITGAQKEMFAESESRHRRFAIMEVEGINEGVVITYDYDSTFGVGSFCVWPDIREAIGTGGYNYLEILGGPHITQSWSIGLGNRIVERAAADFKGPWGLELGSPLAAKMIEIMQRANELATQCEKVSYYEAEKHPKFDYSEPR